MQLFLTILSDMPNIVDPDQSAPSGSMLALFAYSILSDTYLHMPILSKPLVYKISEHLLHSILCGHEMINHKLFINLFLGSKALTLSC